MRALLAVRGLHASYARRPALHGIDLDVAEGGITALLGANGAGKTTTLRAISGLIETRGEVRIAGEAVQGLAPERIARLGVAHVPEGRGTFDALTVEENLRIGALSRRDTLGAVADRETVLGYFPRLRERLDQQAGTLSGGEQQMLALARALMARPRLMLLDEPSFGLAPLLVAEIFAILGRINREQGVGMLLVEQNAALALELAQHAVVLESGRVVRAGPVAAIRRDAGVVAAYLGG